ncbi:hypothetical protein C8R45DRAFT_1220541 [Mycena sanguinolenta]|nr:hypothetical protein C8R45DRAFT_1220541 [Mycena sanguinolenta]
MSMDVKDISHVSTCLRRCTPVSPKELWERSIDAELFWRAGTFYRPPRPPLIRRTQQPVCVPKKTLTPSLSLQTRRRTWTSPRPPSWAHFLSSASNTSRLPSALRVLLAGSEVSDAGDAYPPHWTRAVPFVDNEDRRTFVTPHRHIRRRDCSIAELHVSSTCEELKGLLTATRRRPTPRSSPTPRFNVHPHAEKTLALPPTKSTHISCCISNSTALTGRKDHDDGTQDQELDSTLAGRPPTCVPVYYIYPAGASANATISSATAIRSQASQVGLQLQAKQESVLSSSTTRYLQSVTGGTALLVDWLAQMDCCALVVMSAHTYIRGPGRRLPAYPRRARDLRKHTYPAAAETGGKVPYAADTDTVPFACMQTHRADFSPAQTPTLNSLGAPTLIATAMTWHRHHLRRGAQRKVASCLGPGRRLRGVRRGKGRQRKRKRTEGAEGNANDAAGGRRKKIPWCLLVYSPPYWCPCALDSPSPYDSSIAIARYPYTYVDSTCTSTTRLDALHGSCTPRVLRIIHVSTQLPPGVSALHPGSNCRSSALLHASQSRARHDALASG